MAATKQDKGQDKAQAPELCIHDMDPATCAECNGAAARTDQEGEAAKDEPKEQPKAATWVKGEYQLIQYRPVVTGPDGAEHVCQHFWGHSSEKATRGCAGHLASAAGLSL